MSKLQDKVVLITGAGQGIGVALLPELTKHGAVIAANDLTSINLEEPIAKIISQGGQAKFYTADVCKKLALQTMLNEIIEDFGRIDVLINHASVQPRTPLLEMDEWDWRRTVDVNLTAAFLASQSVGRIMRAQGSGKILNIGPAENGETIRNRSAYLASKSGIEALTVVAATELNEHNISVNTLLPSKKKLTKSLKEAVSLLKSDKNGVRVQIA